MRTAKMLVMLGLAVMAAGCVPSLHPLYTETDIVFEPGLIGAWVEEDGDELWIFQRSKDDAYELTQTKTESSRTNQGEAETQEAKFEAHLVRIGEYLFLDLFPEEPEINNELYKLHLTPAHTIWRIWIEGDVLRMAMLDHDWLKEMIDQKSVAIAHERIDRGESILLTASTEELQKLVLEYAEDTKAFPDPAKLNRQK